MLHIIEYLKTRKNQRKKKNSVFLKCNHFVWNLFSPKIIRQHICTTFPHYKHPWTQHMVSDYLVFCYIHPSSSQSIKRFVCNCITFPLYEKVSQICVSWPYLCTYRWLLTSANSERQNYWVKERVRQSLGRVAEVGVSPAGHTQATLGDGASFLWKHLVLQPSTQGAGQGHVM